MRRDASTFVLCATLVACGGRAELLDFGDAAEDSAPPPDSAPSTDGGIDAEDASIDDSSPPDDSSSPDATDAADSAVPETDADGAGQCTFVFPPTGALIGSANVSGVQNIPSGVTPSGSSILIQRGGPASSCSSDLLLYIADEVPAGSGIYQTLAVAEPLGMDTGFEENVTLTPDGLTIIGLSTGDTGFVTATRSAIGEADFTAAAAGPFAAIVATGGQTLWAPVITADGLAFYYTVRNADGSVNGIYESIRASTSDLFPPGTSMPVEVQNIAQYVTGLTVDRLAIYLEESSVFAAVVLTRASIADPFTNQLAPGPPPLLPGLRPHPIDGCAEVIGTCGSGCSAEGICAWAAE
jgi:hypothetical protein